MRPRPETEETNQPPSPFKNGSAATNIHKAATPTTLNGSTHSVSESNGSGPAYTNGTSSTASESQPTFFGHDREEVTRILIQALSDLGYQSTAGSLSRESGFDLETPYASAFRTAVLRGEWSDAEALLGGTYSHRTGIDGSPDSRRSIDNSIPPRHAWTSNAHVGGLALAQDVDKDEMLFLIRRQKYLELLERRELGSALMVLRQELQPLHQDERQLHSLSSLIMCQSSDDLKFQASWDGAAGQSRKQLLSDLSRSISPSAMIPEHRLAQLLHQVKQYQILNEPYDNSRGIPSLYTDYTADRDDFPLCEVKELDQHKDEVWYLQFSNDGTKLATASKDKTVIIYDTEELKPLHTLTSHRGECTYVAWSPDDSKILTCSQDKHARLWDTKTGLCLRDLTPKDEPVTTAAWAPDGLSFVTGTLDLKDSLSIYNATETDPDAGPAHRIQDLNVRIQDCAIGTLYPPHSIDSPYFYGSLTTDTSQPDGVLPVRLVVISTEKEIFIYDYLRREKIGMINMMNKLTSVCLSRDGREMLVNVEGGEVWSLSVEERRAGKVVQMYRGQEQQNYVIRSCFGGAREGVVISGGEDSYVCIWHRHSGLLLERIKVHRKGCVNAVAWNTANSVMFATAGDDAKVRIWSKASQQHSQSPPQLEPLPNWGNLREDAAGASASK